MSDLAIIIGCLCLCTVGWAFLRRQRQAVEKLKLDYYSGKNSITYEAMPVQLGDLRRGLERYQWKLVESGSGNNGAMNYRFARSVGSAPDAYHLLKAFDNEDDALHKPTVKCDFPMKIKAVELLQIDDAQTH